MEGTHGAASVRHRCAIVLGRSRPGGVVGIADDSGAKEWTRIRNKIGLCGCHVQRRAYSADNSSANRMRRCHCAGLTRQRRDVVLRDMTDGNGGSRALPTLLAVMFVNMVGFGIVVPLLPFYARSFQAPAWQMALIFSAYAAGAFFG